MEQTKRTRRNRKPRRETVNRNFSFTEIIGEQEVEKIRQAFKVTK